MSSYLLYLGVILFYFFLSVTSTQMMKSYIWLETSDGSIQQVEQEVAMFCPLICHQALQKGGGSSKNNAISLPQKVNPAMLSLIFDYCRFHQLPGRSNKVYPLSFNWHIDKSYKPFCS